MSHGGIGLGAAIGAGVGLVPQLIFWMSARVSGPTKPVAGTPCAAWNRATARNVIAP